jgi:hypothetical protein
MTQEVRGDKGLRVALWLATSTSNWPIEKDVQFKARLLVRDCYVVSILAGDCARLVHLSCGVHRRRESNVECQPASGRAQIITEFR